MRKLREILYTCKQCGSIDCARLYENEATPPVINCFHCHAGFNKPLDEMLGQGIGMFPARPAVKAA